MFNLSKTDSINSLTLKKSCLYNKKVRWIAFSLLFFCYSFLLIHFIIANDYTYDEPLSIVCGMEILQNHNFQMNPESGILPQALSALPLINYSVSPPDKRFDRLTFAQKIIFEKYKDEAHKIRILSRISMMFLSMFALFVLFYISSKMTASMTALIPPFLFAFTPLFIAHAPLSNADMCVSIFFLCSVYMLFRLYHKIDLPKLLCSGILLSLLMLSKMNAPFIFFFMLTEICIIVFCNRTVHIRLPHLSLDLKSKICKILCLFAVHAFLLLFLIAVCWCAYGFPGEFSTLPQEENKTGIFQSPGAVPVLMRSLKIHKILPEPFAYGVFFMGKKTAGQNNIWYNGKYISKPSLNLIASVLLKKLPLSFLLLLLLNLGIILFLIFKKKGRNKTILAQPWLIFAGLYFLASIFLWGATTSARYFLPPLLCILPIMTYISIHKNTILLSGLLLTWCLTECAYTAPHHLSYISQIFGGHAKGYLYFSDSSIDWGQDYTNISQVLKEKQIPDDIPLYLRYFGTVLPDFPQKNGRLIHSMAIHSYNDFFEFLPGIYMFSITELHRNDWKELLLFAQKNPLLLQKLQNIYLQIKRKNNKLNLMDRKYIHARKILAAELIRQYCYDRVPDFSINGSILCYILDQKALNQAFSQQVNLLPY